MASFHVTGGVPLSGTVSAGGSKNAALPIMAASILASEPVRLEGVPRLTDVATLAWLLEELGTQSTRTPDGSVCLETIDPTLVRARYGLAHRMRASFCVLGPLLARRGRAVVPLPGGCNIGDRPVDLHLAGLAALGAELRIERGYVVATADRLRGAKIHLAGRRGPTVTGTANVLSAAVLARGTTVITGAAVEPEIVDLGRFLLALGARIEGLGTACIRVRGIDQLGGARWRVIPDRIEAATLLLAAAVTRGSATVTGVVPEHLEEVLLALRTSGAEVEVADDSLLGKGATAGSSSSAKQNARENTAGQAGSGTQIVKSVTVRADGRPRAIDITAAPYPGVPSDVQAQWTALLSLAEGRSTITDRVFPDRFMHVAELNRLGARIRRGGPSAVVEGVRRLDGATVTASDLRASAALVLAGLAAEGRTVVRHVHHLDRGYERLDRKLARLGARIERSAEQNNVSYRACRAR